MPASFLGKDAADFHPDAVASAERFVAVSRRLQDRSFWPLRVFANANLFLWHMDAFAASTDPVPAFAEILDRASAFLELAEAGAPRPGRFSAPLPREADPDKPTAAIFGQIYAPLTDEEYFAEAYATLDVRLSRNDIDPRLLFGGKIVLDAGCGAGKYSAAMARFGAAQVIGVDITADGVAQAAAQASKIPEKDRLSFRVGSVTALPVPDASVDLAWCNSVLHLVDHPERGIAELARVLKPGGLAFIYVNGRFGLLELLVRTLYAANEGLPRDFFQHCLGATGMNPGRVAWVVGFTFANYRFLPKVEVEAMLAASGFSIEKQLTRGIPTDQMEQVAAGLPFGTVKYGEAKLNYLARKVA